MHSNSLAQLITADALRAAIRAIGVLGDIRRGAYSVPRGLLESNGADALERELWRLRGLGELLAPVSTTREIEARAQRVDALEGLLPGAPGMLQVAARFAESDNNADKNRAPFDSEEPEPEEESEEESEEEGTTTLKLSGAVRGGFIRAEEMSLRSKDEKLCRQLGLQGATLTEQQHWATSVLATESAHWRLLEISPLANRLIADHGFADTYAQTRKRARTLYKEQASKGRKKPRNSDLRELRRWNEALKVQLDALADAQSLGAELQALRDQFEVLGAKLETWLNLARLRAALLGGSPGKKTAKDRQQELWRERINAQLDALSSDLLVSVQRSYGLGKSNFRSLIGSELGLEQ